MSSITVESWGGGGAGGGVSINSKSGGGGGGGGGYSKITHSPVTEGATYNVIVGTRGSGSFGNGEKGGDSYFHLISIAKADGGNGGNADNGAGGTGGGGTHNGGSGFGAVSGTPGGGGGSGGIVSPMDVVPVALQVQML